MEDLRKSIAGKAAACHGEIVEVRRHLHRYPELAFEEFETAKFIARFLDKEGIPYRQGIAKTGVVAHIRGKDPGSVTVALRADMDALPILEKNEVEYRSAIEGKMHACGHDVHMASLLGTAKILNELRDRFRGTVRLIFQPSEERYPGGAKVMIEEGVLKDPAPVCILGQHVYPELDAGKAGMKAGNYMASTDEVFITVHGRGGHGAIPDRNIDPVLIGAHIITALQQVVSRAAKPSMPTVISFGRFIADGKTNVIPDQAKMEGIIRTFDEEWRADIKERIRTMAGKIAESMGARAEVFIDPGYPVLVNDEALTLRTLEYARQYLGDSNVEELELRTTAEDFAYYAREIPGCFYRLGIRNKEKGIDSNLHTAGFDVDEASLETGMGLMAWITVNELNKNASA